MTNQGNEQNKGKGNQHGSGGQGTQEREDKITGSVGVQNKQGQNINQGSTTGQKGGQGMGGSQLGGQQNVGGRQQGGVQGNLGGQQGNVRGQQTGQQGNQGQGSRAGGQNEGQQQGGNFGKSGSTQEEEE